MRVPYDLNVKNVNYYHVKRAFKLICELSMTLM